MPARVLVIGLDAAEATLIERWAAEGALPAIAGLSKRGEKVRMGNPLETLPGAIWPEITTGISGGTLGRFYHSHKLHTGEARPRRIESSEVDTSQFYWAIASAGGCRVAAVDQVQSIVAPGLNGVQVMELGVHDRSFETASDPPELLDEMRTRFGEYPVQNCDTAHGSDEAGYCRFVDDLLRAVAIKQEVCLDLLARETWDLFTCTFAETHCSGHQLWHFHDPQDRNHDPDANPRLQGAVREVYGRVDEAVGALIEAAGPDANVLLFTSHGMGLYNGGYQLLPEILIRMGYGSGTGNAARVRSRLPGGARSLLRRLVPAPVRRRLQRAAGTLPLPLESPLTRAVTLINNRCGAIRLNLAGREPNGSVQPGAEAETILADLRSELLALEDPKTGERIVKRVLTPDEAFGEDHSVDLPDLMVVFRDDLGPIEECRSERLGSLRVPLGGNPNLPRTGDHTVQSRLWAAGPAFDHASLREDANVLDIAPTVLALLDVPLPEHIDGKPLIKAPVPA